MEAIGVGFVTSIGDLIVQKLVAYLGQEVNLIFGIDDDLKFIKDEIALATALLKKKSTSNKNPIEGTWLKQVRDLIYEAEDILDEYTYHIARGERNSSSSRHGSSVVNCSSTLVHKFHSLRNLKARRRNATKLGKLKFKAKDVKERGSSYNTIGASNVNKRYEGTSSSSSPMISNDDIFFDSRFRALLVDTDQLVGIAHQRDEIIKWLVAKDDDGKMARQLRVISIVGPGGMGKTTLAMQCYHSPEVTSGHEMFYCRAQVTVSQSFNLGKLLKSLFRQFFNVDSEHMDEVALVMDIKNRLKDKRYVVLLDDVWTHDAWNALKSIFPENGNGSRIIVTTRNEEVARNCSWSDPRFVHRIQPLTLEQSRELFCKRVFSVPPFSCPPNLEELMEGILKKCGGMPLAIVTVAGIIVSNSHRISSREHWQKVHDGIGREWEDGAKSMERILMLSYDDLSDDVKPCFLYLSVIPEDYKFKRSNIMRRWIAEGLVVSNGAGGEVEEVAKSNFNQLVNRNLIYPAHIVWGETKRWRIHDMIHEIIVKKATDESFVCIINNNNNLNLIRRSQRQQQEYYSNYKIRRITIHEDVNLSDDPLPLDMSLIRSLSFFMRLKDDAISGMLTNFKEMRLVRMLDLGGCRIIRNYHVDQICESLLLLKYLDLSSTGITKLPESIGMLQHLEVFDIRYVGFKKKLPGTLIQLKRLSHLYATGFVQLPKGLGVSSMRKCLRVLTLGRIHEDNIGNLEELGGGQLIRLQALDITLITGDSAGSENLLKEKLRAALENLSNTLRSLKLEVARGSTASAAGFLDDLPLMSPPLKLESLRLTRQSLHTRIPTWVESLGHVAKMFLELQHAKGVQYFMKHLGKSLQSLVILHLGLFATDWGSSHGWTSRKADYFVVINIEPEDGFSRLVILSLRFMRQDYNIRVIFQRGALPCLEFLGNGSDGGHLRHMEGLENLAKLKEIACDTNDDLGVLQAAAEAHPNKPKLTIY